MFLLQWYEEWREIRLRTTVCPNCEYLKEQLEMEQQFNRTLFNKLTAEEPKPAVAINTPEPVRPRHIPWRVRRQTLEQEDARAAQVMAKRQQEIQSEVKIAPSTDPDVIALEKEMDIIAKDREHAG